MMPRTYFDCQYIVIMIIRPRAITYLSLRVSHQSKFRILFNVELCAGCNLLHTIFATIFTTKNYFKYNSSLSILQPVISAPRANVDTCASDILAEQKQVRAEIKEIKGLVLGLKSQIAHLQAVIEKGNKLVLLLVVSI